MHEVINFCKNTYCLLSRVGRIKILSLVCMLGMDCENPAVVDVAVASDVPHKIGGIELTLPAGAE